MFALAASNRHHVDLFAGPARLLDEDGCRPLLVSLDAWYAQGATARGWSRGLLTEELPLFVQLPQPFAGLDWKTQMATAAAARDPVTDWLREAGVSVLAVANDTGVVEQLLVHQAQELGIPVMLLQEGDWSAENVRRRHPGRLMIGEGGCDAVAAWGPRGAGYFAELGFGDKVTQTGCPKVVEAVLSAGDLRGTMDLAPTGPLVLLVLQCFARYGLMTREEERGVYEEALSALLQDEGISVLVAPHPSHLPEELAWYRELVTRHPRAAFLDRVDTEEVVPSVDLVAGVCSAVFSEAARHDVPALGLAYAWSLYPLDSQVPVMRLDAPEDLRRLAAESGWTARVEAHVAPIREAYLQHTFAAEGDEAARRVKELLQELDEPATAAGARITALAAVGDADRNQVPALLGAVQGQRGVEVELVLLDRTRKGDLEAPPGVRVARAGHPSPGLQIRKALEHATGELVAWIEPGTLSVPGRLRRQARFMEDHPECDLVTCDLYLAQGPDVRTARTMADPLEPGLGPFRRATLMARRAALAGLPATCFASAEEILHRELHESGRTGVLGQPLVTVSEPRYRSTAQEEPVPAARKPEAPGKAPELSVILCTYRRREVLFECLESFCRQTAPAGSFEIIVVEDGADEQDERAFQELEFPVPVSWMRGPGRGLAAARNTGIAAARGRLLLFINDDTIAFPDLVQRHVQAHDAAGGRREAVLGTFEQPPEALRNALMRYLEQSHEVFAYAKMQPGGLYDWTRFWTCNISLPAAAVEEAGGFDEDFRAYGAEDTDLGVRLHQRGWSVRYCADARAYHRHTLDVEAFRRRQITVARAWVRLFCKHPQLLLHPHWTWASSATRESCQQALARNLPRMESWKQALQALACVEVGAFEGITAEHGELGASLLEGLGAVLRPLNGLWWSQGFAEGMEEHGILGFPEILQTVPYELQGTRGTKVLALPDWSRRDLWEPVLGTFLSAYGPQDDLCLVLLPESAMGWPAERVARELVGLALRCGDGAALPQPAVQDQPAKPDDLARVIGSADALLDLPGPGGARHRELAAAAGVPVLDPEDAGTWRAAGLPAPSRAVASAPLPLQVEARHRLLAWPDYSREGDLEALLELCGPELSGCRDWCLCLRHEPAADGDYAVVLQQVRNAVERAGKRGHTLNVHLASDALEPGQLPRLAASVDAVAAPASAGGGPRADLVQRLERPVVGTREELAELVRGLEAREARLEWELVAQPGEMDFHRDSSFRQGPQFMEHTERLFRSWGYSPDAFQGRLVVDLGAGSKLRSRYFQGARIAAVEPLADRMRAEIPWCDLDTAERVFGSPAETCIQELVGRAALVMCLNVLDHTYDPGAIIRNAAAYLDADGELVLSLDLHDDADHLHPVHLDRESLLSLCREAGLEPLREYTGLPGSRSYGHGEAFTLVLRRAAVSLPAGGTPGT